jgi:putative transposase
MARLTTRSRGRLPHWETADAIYFITFRLCDSLPAPMLREIERQVQVLSATIREVAGSEFEALQQLRLERARHLEKYLDSGAGKCILRNPIAAEIVSSALNFWAAKRYSLHAWCVMPNHVHAVLQLGSGEELASVVHSWKSYSAKKINSALLHTGSVWQREYYDHLVRSEQEYARIVRYVEANPLVAGLRDWPFVTRGQDALASAGKMPALR